MEMQERYFATYKDLNYLFPGLWTCNGVFWRRLYWWTLACLICFIWRTPKGTWESSDNLQVGVFFSLLLVVSDTDWIGCHQKDKKKYINTIRNMRKNSVNDEALKMSSWVNEKRSMRRWELSFLLATDWNTILLFSKFKRMDTIMMHGLIIFVFWRMKELIGKLWVFFSSFHLHPFSGGGHLWKSDCKSSPQQRWFLW